MNFVRLGNSGLKITELTFGTALTIGTEHKDNEFAKSMIDKAWSMGIRSFDVSNNYGDGQAEILLGAALRPYPRQEYVLATKGSWPIGEGVFYKGLSRKHILWAFDESIKRLQADYVDIYYAHRYDPEVCMEEIVRTFNWLINQGRVRYWATSEWPVQALEECYRVCQQLCLEPPIAEQSFYSYAVQKAKVNGVMEFCSQHSMGMLAFGPLAQGTLTGKYRDSIPENSRIYKSAQIGYDKTINIYQQNKSIINSFLDLCEDYTVEPVAAALQWCIKNEIYPVVGASTPEQLEINALALEAIIPEQFFIKMAQIYKMARD